MGNPLKEIVTVLLPKVYSVNYLLKSNVEIKTKYKITAENWNKRGAWIKFYKLNKWSLE